MPDLNVMLLEQARNGLQAELDAAVTNGDTEAARKVAAKLSDLNTAAAPRPQTGYGDAEIRAELNKLPWFGVDPKKSGRTIELGKTMDPKKFNNAAEFAAALVKVVDEEFKPAIKEPPENETNEEREEREAKEAEAADKDKLPKKPRASDGPTDGDTGAGRTRRTSGPWLKISDAPDDVRKEINRTADKFAPKTKEGREKFVAKALEAHYAKAQLAKGKK
jgi:hypothetical protein